MDDEKRPKTADWEPGTLEKTRRAIGDIDPEEAKAMSLKLGGEVMYERSSMNGKNSARSNTGCIIRKHDSEESGNSAAEKSEPEKNERPRPSREGLPPISAKMNAMLNKLMMSPEYNIKRDFGVFNFIKYFQKDGQEQISSDFCTVAIKSHIDKIQEFITAIKTFIQLSPAPYKTRIENEVDSKFIFLRMVSSWTTQQLRLIHMNLKEQPQPYIVQDLIPYTRAVYRLAIQLYYFGDAKIPGLIKEIYEDASKCAGAPREKLYNAAKDAIAGWLYIQAEIIQKLYPLLMRMCSDTFEEYPDFFKVKTASILKFLGLHKYDLLLPERPKERDGAQKPAEEQKPRAKANVGIKDEIVEAGIRLLDQLFPQAGFSMLESHPDFYPYFQPLYKFADGFNVLHPENPLQTTIVLLRIAEDCFQGCRNIKFNEEEQDSAAGKNSDSMEKAIDEWSGYRETVFERLYCEPLNHFVNEAYSQSDFENSRLGKKIINSLLWQTRYHFLPNFKFEQVILERPADDSKLPPLFRRTNFMRKFLMEAMAQCDAAKQARTPVEKIQNPWEPYRFDIPNEISKRIDVILGGQSKSKSANATNANLLKYTLCIVSVLDWWINNPESPAYSMSSKNIYRISEEDGKPQFSVPVRSDQNKLFVEVVRAAYQNKPPQS